MATVWVNPIQEILEKNSAAAQYLTRNDFAASRATTPEEYEAVLEYAELKKKVMTLTPEQGRRYQELYRIVKPLYEAAEKDIEATYWTEGGAGYEEPEPEVGQPTFTIDGQEYYWTSQGPIPTSQTIPQETALGTDIGQTAIGSNYFYDYATGTFKVGDPLQYQFGAQAEAQGLTPDEFAQRLQAGEYPAYDPTLAGVGYPLATGEGAATPQGQLIGEGDGWRLYEADSSIGIMPWSTPEDVGYIGPGTRTAEVYYQNPLTGVWESTGKFIPLEGSASQAGAAYLQTLSQTYGVSELPEGYYESPFDVPTDIAEEYGIVYDPATMTWRVGGFGETTGLSEFEQWYMGEKLKIDQQAQALKEQEFQWKQAQAGQLTEWQQEQLDLAWAELEQASEMTEYQSEQIRLQEEYQSWQMGQAEREYESQLAARGPGAWMESAAYTGKAPVVQPWQVPLMPEQYGLQAGQEIPGWTQESAQGMPEMTRPSQQYWARIGPSAQEQLYSYKQARTGATPEETQWRQWQTAPPGGGRMGLAYAK